MMKTFKLVFLVVLGFTFSASAEERVIEITASGASKSLAIEAGLIRAIAQVKGTEINSKAMRVANQVRKDGKTTTNIALSNITAMKTKGQISSYEVLEESCNETCEVLLRVSVPVYKSPGLSLDKRRKLVVAPFEGENGELFSNNLQSAFVQTRRFAILDRQHNSEYAAEKRLLLSEDTALKEKMRLGQVLGMDYLVVGSVSFRDDSYETESSFTGERSYVEDIVSEINYKVINLATRQVKWQDNVIIPSNIQDPASAHAIARDITSAIYPIKIVSNQNDNVVLNQGGTSVQIGEVFDIFELGEKLIDPYTKESLGREERYVGKVKIVKVTSKVSYAAVIEGELSTMNVGSVVRPSMLDYFDSESRAEPKATVEASPAGGIIIPLPTKPKPSPNGGVVIKN